MTNDMSLSSYDEQYYNDLVGFASAKSLHKAVKKHQYLTWIITRQHFQVICTFHLKTEKLKTKLRYLKTKSGKKSEKEDVVVSRLFGNIIESLRHEIDFIMSAIYPDYNPSSFKAFELLEFLIPLYSSNVIYQRMDYFTAFIEDFQRIVQIHDEFVKFYETCSPMNWQLFGYWAYMCLIFQFRAIRVECSNQLVHLLGLNTCSKNQYLLGFCFNPIVRFFQRRHRVWSYDMSILEDAGLGVSVEFISQFFINDKGHVHSRLQTMFESKIRTVTMFEFEMLRFSLNAWLGHMALSLSRVSSNRDHGRLGKEEEEEGEEEEMCLNSGNLIPFLGIELRIQKLIHVMESGEPMDDFEEFFKTNTVSKEDLCKNFFTTPNPFQFSNSVF